MCSLLTLAIMHFTLNIMLSHQSMPLTQTIVFAKFSQSCDDFSAPFVHNYILQLLLNIIHTIAHVCAYVRTHTLSQAECLIRIPYCESSMTRHSFRFICCKSHHRALKMLKYFTTHSLNLDFLLLTCE
jgi:hypothetical protein